MSKCQEVGQVQLLRKRCWKIKLSEINGVWYSLNLLEGNEVILTAVPYPSSAASLQDNSPHPQGKKGEQSVPNQRIRACLAHPQGERDQILLLLAHTGNFKARLRAPTVAEGSEAAQGGRIKYNEEHTRHSMRWRGTILYGFSGLLSLTFFGKVK